VLGSNTGCREGDVFRSKSLLEEKLDLVIAGVHGVLAGAGRGGMLLRGMDNEGVYVLVVTDHAIHE
jgi:hypothetical protein